MARSAIRRVRALSAPSSSPSGLEPYAGHSCTSGIRRIGHEQHPMASPSEAPTGRVAGNRDGSADFDPCPPGHHLDVGADAMTRQCVICGREFTVVRRIGRARVLCSAPCRKQRKLDIRLRWRRIFKPTQPWRVTSQDDCRGSMALVFAGIVPGCLLIGGATLDLGYRNVQVVKTRGCAEAAVLGLVQGGMTGASRMASANGLWPVWRVPDAWRGRSAVRSRPRVSHCPDSLSANFLCGWQRIYLRGSSRRSAGDG